MHHLVYDSLWCRDYYTPSSLFSTTPPPHKLSRTSSMLHAYNSSLALSSTLDNLLFVDVHTYTVIMYKRWESIPLGNEVANTQTWSIHYVRTCAARPQSVSMFSHQDQVVAEWPLSKAYHGLFFCTSIVLPLLRWRQNGVRPCLSLWKVFTTDDGMWYWKVQRTVLRHIFVRSGTQALD